MSKVALLSNVTVNLLAETLKGKIEIYTPDGFDSWQQEIYMEESGLYSFKPEAIVILLYADSFSDSWSKKESGEKVINEWMDAVKVVVERLPGVPVFVSDIDINSIHCHYGAEKRLEQYFEQIMVEKIEKVHDCSASVYVLPVKKAIADLGRKNFYSSKMWYIGSMPYGMKGISSLSNLILEYTSVTKGAKKKCIAVDLDNTLWGGVIGEDGVEGIVLSNNKEGARYKDTQRILKKMKDEGVMLTILSKNNVEDVEAAMQHPDMLLHHEDFVAEVINWTSKTENICDLAKTLNIGLDAFVFLDDNPAEREQMKTICPEVTVLDFPKDTSLLPTVVEKAYYDYFFALEVSSEDVKKTDMYRSEVKRKKEQKNAGTITDYLKNLGMTIVIHDMKPEEEKRVTQLTNKTNQFNLTTIRYSEADIHNLANDNDSEVLTVHMMDKYGDQGLVSVIILRYLDEIALIDTFLMSCRVMGRTAEDIILEAVKTRAKARGCEQIRGSFIKTIKNKPVEELYDKFGFKILKTCGDETKTGYRKDYGIEIADMAGANNVFSEVSMFGD